MLCFHKAPLSRLQDLGSCCVLVKIRSSSLKDKSACLIHGRSTGERSGDLPRTGQLFSSALSGGVQSRSAFHSSTPHEGILRLRILSQRLHALHAIAADDTGLTISMPQLISCTTCHCSSLHIHWLSTNEMEFADTSRHLLVFSASSARQEVYKLRSS